ncbi:MAG TPA: hypothetical protein VEM36_13770 [Xanthobacteraceae bacterium]|nr:hypothetical protein [Xanthobacteraceae bacterium]
MTVGELGALFRRNGVPDYFYVLDGNLGPGECYGIEKSDGGWVVYYSERGKKNVLDRVSGEDAACRLMLKYINDAMQHQFGRSIAPL